MNMARHFIDLNWEVFLSQLASELGFVSEAAQKFVCKGSNNHETMSVCEFATGDFGKNCSSLTSEIGLMQSYLFLLVTISTSGCQRNEHVMQSLEVLDHEEQAKEQQVNTEGKYPCRSPGCSKTFAHDGKLRREYEAKHNPPAMIDSPSSNMLTTDSKICEDEIGDMLPYQKSSSILWHAYLKFLGYNFRRGRWAYTLLLEIFPHIPETPGYISNKSTP
ncbi:hypothetical protein ACROYT_G015164 [Oculina patagonica]